MREYRFGFNVRAATSPGEFRETCRDAEAFGYDVCLVPDHLGHDCPSPFVTMVAAAQATDRMRVGSFVLNIGFWNPSMLARDAAATDLLTGGRLELGLGAGHMKSEFDAAGIPWQPLGERMDRLEWTLDELDRLYAPDAPDGYSTAQSPRPPIMLAGLNDRILTLAARRADIVGHTAIWQAKGKAPGTLRIGTHEEFAERVRFFREKAGERVDEIEANFLIQAVVVTDDPLGAMEKVVAEHGLEYTAQELLDAPTMFVGTVDEIVAQLADYRERYGITYFSVHEPYMRAFGPVIEKIRGRAA
jgi:probable F420-dependent oxidoreductase